MIKKITLFIALLFISTSGMAQWLSFKKPAPPPPYTYDSYSQDPQGAAKIKEAQAMIASALDTKKKELNTPANLPPPLKWTGVPELVLPSQASTPSSNIRNNPLPSNSNINTLQTPPPASIGSSGIKPSTWHTTINY